MYVPPAVAVAMAPVSRSITVLSAVILVPYTQQGTQSTGPAVMPTYGAGGSSTGQSYIFCG